MLLWKYNNDYYWSLKCNKINEKFEREVRLFILYHQIRFIDFNENMFLKFKQKHEFKYYYYFHKLLYALLLKMNSKLVLIISIGYVYTKSIEDL